MNFLRKFLNSFPGRARIFTFFIFLIATALIGQLYFVQIVKGEMYRAMAEKQYNPSSSVFDRGSLYFSEKDGHLVSAATVESGFILAINPEKILDAEKAYSAILPILPLDREAFLAKAGRKDDPYEEIARRVPPDTAEKIRALGLPGVDLYTDRWRKYPGETLAAQTIGFLGFEDDGETESGRYGAERYYDDILDRSGGHKQNFFAEIFAAVEGAATNGFKIKGDVVLTIEPSVQSHLEKKLLEIKNEWKPDLVGGIIINPKDGSIYALAATPTFDPNEFSKEKDLSVFGNPLVENVYEMGSVVKPLVMAAAFDEGVLTAEDTYNDYHGYVNVGGANIFNFDLKARGANVPMQEVLNQSLNTGMVHVMKQMGKEKTGERLLAYGFGDETGIDLPNEIPGIVENLNSPREIEYATAAFGQGIALTPLAITRALAALGNGGMLVTPHIMKEVRYGVGLSKQYVSVGDKRVLKPETSEEITRMLVEVVDKALLGGTVKLPNYSIAAKTGTAEISKGDGRGYYDDRYLHSFFGYFPAYDPEFLVFLFSIDPKGAKYASQTLTDPFMDTAKFLLTYYAIPPDR